MPWNLSHHFEDAAMRDPARLELPGHHFAAVSSLARFGLRDRCGGFDHQNCDENPGEYESRSL
jgi:hypothetical protein